MTQLRSNVPIEPVVDTVSYHYTCCSTCNGMLIYVGTPVLTHRTMGTAPLHYITTATYHHILDLSFSMMMVCAAAHPPRRTPVCDVVHAPPTVGHISCGAYNAPIKCAYTHVGQVVTSAGHVVSHARVHMRMPCILIAL